MQQILVATEKYGELNDYFVENKIKKVFVYDIKK